MTDSVAGTRVDYVIVGHVCLDTGRAGARLGGTAAYAGVTAARLGRRVGIVTSIGPEADLSALPPGVTVYCVPAPVSTRFRNVYRHGTRRQTLLARAAPLALDDVPAAWRAAPVVHVAPIAQEVAPELVCALHAPGRFVGATPQGWLRTWDARGMVRPLPVADLLASLAAATALVLSDEDLAADPTGAARLAAAGTWVALTRGAAGARLFLGPRVVDVPACPARAVHPTGAGDVFAAAWFVRLAAGEEPIAAARYAACAAACAIERPGLAGIPTPEQIEERLAQWAA